MSITGRLVLPPDVAVVPVAALPADIRVRLVLAGGEYAVSRPRTRAVPRIIGADAADLLARFRAPASVVEVVLDYSRVRAVDPRTTLAEAFPIIRDLLSAGLLRSAGQAMDEATTPSLRVGDRVGDVTLGHPVHLLDDVEVYWGRSADGTLVAVKIGRPSLDDEGRAAFRRETLILQYLDGRAAPRLLGCGQSGGRPYLVLDWCPGVDAEVASAEWRSNTATDARTALARVCGAVLDAFVQLHDAGVLHGDVHPSNVLIDGRGRVHIVDYAFARADGHTADCSPPPRVGAGIFFEAEYACACRAALRPPPVTAAGEQYALAALVYGMLTGACYVDFSLEQHEALRQIAEDPPVAFARRAIIGWAQTEAVLVTALCKDPRDRYTSVAAFADAFRTAAAADTGTSADGCGDHRSRDLSDAGWRTDREHLRSGWGQSVLTRFDFGRPPLADPVHTCPTGSVTYGAAGIAYAVYRTALLGDDPRQLAMADVWCSTAERRVACPDAFWSVAEEVTPSTVSTSSPYHAAAGVHAVRALIARASGDLPGQTAALARFIAASRPDDDRPELTLDLALGRTGTLLVASLLLDAAPDPAELDRAPLVRVGTDALEAVWSRIDGVRSGAEEYGSLVSGMAHGWAGVLYASLRWCAAARVTPPAGLADRLLMLADGAEPAGRGCRWPLRLGDYSDAPDDAASWCSGSAGFVHLWTQAFDATDDERFLALAHGAAWHTWEHPATYPDLCCGLAGQGYALLEVYKRTRDRLWLRRAEHLAVAAARHADVLTAHPDSLFKGRVGVALLGCDLERPEGACMPFFGAEAWTAPPCVSLEGRWT